MPYGTGSCTYCACIAKVAFLSNFQFFFIICTTYCKKKLPAFTAKKNTRLDDFFVHDLHFSPEGVRKLSLTKANNMGIRLKSAFGACLSVATLLHGNPQNRRKPQMYAVYNRMFALLQEFVSKNTLRNLTDVRLQR